MQTQQFECKITVKTVYISQILPWLYILCLIAIKLVMKNNETGGDQFKKIGQYSYLSKDVVGKGYSSVVYRAQNDSNGQTLALKLIDMKNMKGDVHKTLLNNQIQILRLLSNLQNVIKVHEILSTKSHTCIVTQFCEGGDLSKIIKARSTIPEREALQILKEIINGYRGINRFGIVHRDLKPANIFFNEGKVKIADFGFAIRNADIKKSSNYNVGSPVYMPLEALNDNNYSPKSDIWAIGVIFYEMLTGHTPWKAKTQADLKRQIKAISIKSLLPTRISRSSQDFLLKALQLNVSLRMSPDEMINFFDGSNLNEQVFTSTNLRTNSLFRTRAVSQEKEDRLGATNSQLSKNTVTAPKTYRKMNLFGQLNGLQKITEGLLPIQKIADTNIGFDRIGEQKGLANLAKTAAGMTNQWMPDHKKTSAHLLSQVHFCRFLYKLIERMQKLGVGSQKVKIMMSVIILGKLQEIKELSLVNSKYAVIFRRSKQFHKLQELVDQYTLKYEKLSRFKDNQGYKQAIDGIQSELGYQITSLYQKVNCLTALEGHQQEIILLDYLITTKQLLVINQSNDIEYFHKKSKIEAIVEGKPAKNITEEHFDAIRHKLKIFKLIA